MLLHFKTELRCLILWYGMPCHLAQSLQLVSRSNCCCLISLQWNHLRPSHWFLMKIILILLMSVQQIGPFPALIIPTIGESFGIRRKRKKMVTIFGMISYQAPQPLPICIWTIRIQMTLLWLKRPLIRLVKIFKQTKSLPYRANNYLPTKKNIFANHAIDTCVMLTRFLDTICQSCILKEKLCSH